MLEDTGGVRKLGSVDVSCHSGRIEETRIIRSSRADILRFFTPLRYVQNDRVMGATFRMTVLGELSSE